MNARHAATVISGLSMIVCDVAAISTEQNLWVAMLSMVLFATSAIWMEAE